MSDRPFLWTGRRDRTLRESRADGFTYRECARIIGAGCTEADARARMKEISSQGAPARAAFGKHVGAQPSAPEPARVAASGPAAEVHRKEASPPAKGLIPLPKYGEMEKKYDRFTRAKLGMD